MKLLEIVKYENERTQNIDIEEVIKLLKENCQNSLKSWKKSPIYRGDSIFVNTDFCVGDSENAEPRKSRHSHNYYTLWLDNSPKWKDFPKRALSFICSSSYESARAFGTITVAIPFDDAKIGVCPDSDIWDAFSEHLQSLVDFTYSAINILGYSDPKKFTNLKTVLSKITKNDIIDKVNEILTNIAATIDENDFADKVNEIKEDINNIINRRISNSSNFSDLAKSIAKSASEILRIDMESNETLADLYDRLLTPERFQHFSNGIYNIDHNKEVFIEGKCIFINPSKLSKEAHDRLDKEFGLILKRAY